MPTAPHNDRVGDWPSEAAARIEQVVGLVRDHSTRPLLTAVRYLTLGIVAFVVVAIAGILSAAGLLRLLDDVVFSHRVWASYTLLGGIFSVAGLFLLWLRNRPQPRGGTK
jgi:hypothetical protein